MTFRSRSFYNLILIKAFNLNMHLTVNKLILFSFQITIGISYSLLASCLWPLVPLIVPENQLGTAYGMWDIIGYDMFINMQHQRFCIKTYYIFQMPGRAKLRTGNCYDIGGNHRWPLRILNAGDVLPKLSFRYDYNMQ